MAAAVALAFGAAVEQATGAARIRVMVTLPPQRDFVERIGGDRVAVDVMVAPGSDPHTYEPRPAQLVALARAQVYFAIGDAFEEAWLGRLGAERSGGPGGVPGTGRGIHVVRTDAGIRKLGGVAPAPAGAADASGAAGAQTGADPHIWLAPLLVKVQAQHIRDGLTAADPAGKDVYAANYERFAAELERMDREFRALFRDVPRREFVVFHPAWGYFAQAYGLTQTAVEVDGKSPTAGQMQKLVGRMQQQRIRVLFAQPQRSLRMAETVAASVGARVVVADDLAADWEPNLRTVAQQLSSALSGAAP